MSTNVVFDGSQEPPSKRRRLSMTDDDDRIHIITTSMATPLSTDASKRNDQVTEEDKETQVGIQAFVNTSTRFVGILKQRYSDFLVNEILPNGDVVHLRNTKAPKSKRSENQEEVTKPAINTPVQSLADHSTSNTANSPDITKDAESKNDYADITADEREVLVNLLNAQAVDEILKLYRSMRDHPEVKPKAQPTVRTQFTSDRSVRSEIHQRIREIFKSSIESSTDKNGVLVLTAARANTQGWQQRGQRATSSNKGQRPGKLGWIDRGGEYVHFTLYKENRDTMEAISWLTRQLKANPKSFQFAGTKDRRAITTQRCSAYRVEAEKLAAQNQSLRGSKIGDFEYRPNGLELGDLGGNEFVITLRDCHVSGVDGGNVDLKVVEQDMQQRMQSLRDNGYLNYYGQQRFGTFSTRTDTIGQHILKENFGAACDAILSFDQGALAAAQQPDLSTIIGQDDRDRALAIHKWRMENTLNAALDLLPRKFSAEANLMRQLTKHPSDYLGALLLIQRNLRMMYVHAYQSYIWNMAATNRIKLYGNKAVKGDLVLVNEHRDKEFVPENMNIDSAAAVDADGEQIIEASGDDRATREDDVFERARALTEEDINSGKYSIFDIVLPQPGYDILYPDNASGEYYKTFMSSPEGGELDPHSMRRKHRDFSLSGSYRKLLARIGQHFEVSVHTYERDEEQFVKTDLDIMQEAKKTQQPTVREEISNGHNKPDVVEGAKRGKVAVVLKFQLGTSQYATMALRELSRSGITQYKPDFSGGR